MYPVSEGFLQALKEPSVEEDIKGIITIRYPTYKSINITGADIYNNAVKISNSAMDGNFALGSANSSTLTIELIDKYTEPYSFRGANIVIKYGLKVNGVFEYVEFPKFYNAEVERQHNTIILTAVDAMTKLKSNYYTTSTNTVKNWLQNIAYNASLNLDLTVLESSFNSTVLNKSIDVTLAVSTEIETYWDLLNWICKAIGAFAIIRRRSGSDELFICNGTNGATASIDYKYCNETTISDVDVSFYRVEMVVDNRVNTLSTGSGNYLFSLDANPLINSSNYYDFLVGIKDKLSVLAYTPISQDYFGNPALEIGDMFTTNNKTALLTSIDWSYSGMQHLESANYTPESLSVTTKTDKAVNAVKTTASTALKNAQTAQETAEEVKNTTQGLLNNSIAFRRRFPVNLDGNSVPPLAEMEFTLATNPSNIVFGVSNVIFGATFATTSSTGGNMIFRYILDGDDIYSKDYQMTKRFSSGEDTHTITFAFPELKSGKHTLKVPIGSTSEATLSKLSAWLLAPAITGKASFDPCIIKINVPPNTSQQTSNPNNKVTIEIAGDIDWGDGTKSNASGARGHTYPVVNQAKSYTITITPIKDVILVGAVTDFPCNSSYFYTEMGRRFNEIHFPLSTNRVSFKPLPNLTKLTFDPNARIETLNLSLMGGQLTELDIPNVNELIGIQGSPTLTLLKVHFLGDAPKISNCGGNTALATVELTGQLGIIQNASFAGCTALTEITIPESVTQIGLDTFYGCTNLTTIKGVAGSYAQTYAIENGYQFIEI